MRRQRATVIPTEGIGLVEGGREQRIAPGLHVFVDGFISEARCADALDQQLRHRAIYQALIAPVVEAAGESPGEPQTGIALAHQQLACVAESVPREKSAPLSRTLVWQQERFGLTAYGRPGVSRCFRLIFRFTNLTRVRQFERMFRYQKTGYAIFQAIFGTTFLITRGPLGRRRPR